mmetsp:Transcript_2177/g.6511  ORF Transcript_2177/g.6511 Transcript_2177/m.6511 type:complete len:277 (-) Transcript_2177:635-1465(-)
MVLASEQRGYAWPRAGLRGRVIEQISIALDLPHQPYQVLAPAMHDNEPDKQRRQSHKLHPDHWETLVVDPIELDDLRVLHPRLPTASELARVHARRGVLRISLARRDLPLREKPPVVLLIQGEHLDEVGDITELRGQDFLRNHLLEWESAQIAIDAPIWRARVRLQAVRARRRSRREGHADEAFRRDAADGLPRLPGVGQDRRPCGVRRPHSLVLRRVRRIRHRDVQAAVLDLLLQKAQRVPDTALHQQGLATPVLAIRRAPHEVRAIPFRLAAEP